MPIGGAEDKLGKKTVLARFVTLCGGSSAQIVVLPTASSVPMETGARYQELFRAFGVDAVTVVYINSRADAEMSSAVQAIQSATGIFLTGGDQVKLVSLIGGTPVSEAITQRHARGAVIGGTSAGASAQSLHMIAFGKSGSLPRQRMIQLAPGLGLCPHLIIDQHFRQRDRIGRLMSAVALNPSLLGVGIDEDTGLIIAPDGIAEVYGTHSVTIVDGAGLRYTDVHAVKGYGEIAMHSITVHILTHGHRFDIQRRLPIPPSEA